MKMIHNGIEYGDMQLIAEAYWVMKNLIDLNNEEMADVFARWNEGKLRSYLIEITANILRHKDKTGGYLIDKILDAAGQKGTGKWSVINAMELGMPLGLIATAVFERSLSAQKDLRRLASKQFQCQHTQPIYNKAELVKNIFSALYASKLVSYAQGFACCNVLPMLSTGILIWPPLLVCGVADVSFVVYSSTILLPLSKHPINLSTCCWLLISGKKSRRCFPVGRVSLQKR